MSHITELLLRVIQEIIQKKIDVEVGDIKFGFRKESGTREGIFSLNVIAQKHIDVRKDLYLSALLITLKPLTESTTSS